jgi:DNA-directed RNA polymerase beta subunit
MRQMTEDKYHVRARGQVQLLSRQPTEGKATSGGLRWGEMERDCAINAGLSHFLAEKFGQDSDGELIHLCTKCHVLCKNQCPEHPDLPLDIVHVPQAFTLMLAELRAMNIATRLSVK